MPFFVVARGISGEGSVAGQIDFDPDRFPLDLVFDPANLVERLPGWGGKIPLVIAADLRDEFRLPTEPRVFRLCVCSQALLQPLELCWVPQRLHLPQDQKVPTNRAASVLLQFVLSPLLPRNHTPQQKLRNCTLPWFPRAPRSDSPTAIPSGVSRRAERNFQATQSVIASAGWSE